MNRPNHRHPSRVRKPNSRSNNHRSTLPSLENFSLRLRPFHDCFSTLTGRYSTVGGPSKSESTIEPEAKDTPTTTITTQTTTTTATATAAAATATLLEPVEYTGTEDDDWANLDEKIKSREKIGAEDFKFVNGLLDNITNERNTLITPKKNEKLPTFEQAYAQSWVDVGRKDMEMVDPEKIDALEQAFYGLGDDGYDSDDTLAPGLIGTQPTPEELFDGFRACQDELKENLKELYRDELALHAYLSCYPQIILIFSPFPNPEKCCYPLPALPGTRTFQKAEFKGMKRYCLLAVVKGYWPPINGDERARCGRAHDHDKIVMVETQKLPMESRAVLELRMLWSTRAMLEVNGGPDFKSLAAWIGSGGAQRERAQWSGGRGLQEYESARVERDKL
ncbi:hypothetical protein EX30DRAFT_393113 [Ascodesmis nigricans]|uniref:Uncharacterized protein n=1 Tax=Ascodesmis nigricans TaxID=341454 RepID=A0A4S2N387_9PEZI|nr:hypothetical protein EX30DRAFT_393113 [Ascodesmis nigricans]